MTEDSDPWHKFMAGVTPLLKNPFGNKKKSVVSQQAGINVDVSCPVEDFAALLAESENPPLKGEEFHKPLEKNAGPPSLPSAEQAAKSSVQMDRRTQKRLERGEMPIEGRLDLHGYNRHIAYDLLCQFVQNSYAQQKRCLLVITGKGLSSKKSENWTDPAIGVLKTLVPQWLEAAPLKHHVLQYTTAQQKDGGHGALYIYLRKNP